MITRTAKTLLLAGVGFYFALVVFNNVTDFDSNYQFVRHVLSMDSTFPANHGLWRALTAPQLHLAFYLVIIGVEIATTILLGWGVVRLLGAMRKPAGLFNGAKGVAITGLTLAMSMWLVGFLSVGGEWFLMWQSRIWNGQDAAFRMFAVEGLVLLILMQPEGADQP
jgi:predicted small integral membrane protein